MYMPASPRILSTPTRIGTGALNCDASVLPGALVGAAGGGAAVALELLAAGGAVVAGGLLGAQPPTRSARPSRVSARARSSCTNASFGAAGYVLAGTMALSGARRSTDLLRADWNLSGTRIELQEANAAVPDGHLLVQEDAPARARDHAGERQPHA